MLRIEVAHTFDVSVAEAFAYITDMKNWPEYWPDFIRIDNPAAAGWSNPGDRATVVIKLLNRERALNMELKAFQKDACVTYVSRQRGLPDVRHERRFEAARNGCVYRLIVEYEPRTVLRVSSIGRLSDDPSSRPCDGRCKTSIDFCAQCWLLADALIGVQRLDFSGHATLFRTKRCSLMCVAVNQQPFCVRTVSHTPRHPGATPSFTGTR
jgi:hypothetical protein